LSIPIVYNTSSYDDKDALATLEGLVDIYLPDFKYFTEKTAELLSSAKDYPTAARIAISEMVRQTGSALLDESGMLVRGTVVRILLLPGHVAEAKLVLKYLYDTYGDSIYVSLMNQYTPPADMSAPLNRTVTHEEYRQLTDYAVKLGVKNAFVQEFGTASESFIPDFDLVGLK
jgi:putative pyruvate formate lyase activating enzyme